MDLSVANSALTGIVAAQTMFDASAQAAYRVRAPAGGTGAATGTSGASAPMNVDIAVLRMALDSERSLVEIFA